MSETIWGTVSYQAPCGHWETRPQAWQLTIFTEVPAIRGADYPSLAKVWENDSDDAAFNDLPAPEEYRP